MLQRDALFATNQENASDLEQISRITDLLGSPDDATWPGMQHLPVTVKFKPRPRQNLSQIFGAKGACKDAVDLLSKLLCFDPNRRLTAAKALEHAYFAAHPPPAPKEKIAEAVEETREMRAEARDTAKEGAGIKRKAAGSPVVG
jgi:cell division cycle 2-like protein